MGALAALAEMLPGLKGLLAFYAPAGSLSGKAAISVLVFIGARLVLDRAWRTRAIDTRRCIVWSALMVASGLVGTFPPFFYLFG